MGAGNTEQKAVAIANGASLSDAVNLAGFRAVGIQMPSAWTAANLTFQASFDGTTYVDLYDDAGNEQTATAAASRFMFLTPAEWAGIRYLKIRSGTTSVPVNQGAARTIQLITRPLE
jgi:hypothetical protein